MYDNNENENEKKQAFGKKNYVQALLIGLVFLIIGSVLVYEKLPLTSMSIEKGTVTESSHCICTNKGHSTSRGFKDIYQFSYNGVTYEGSVSGCSCGLFTSNNAGKSISVVFDKNNPKNNTDLSSLLFLLLFPLVGLGATSFGVYGIAKNK